ncbi:hypothetical protein B0H19DRAFT_1260738 [Mycena capillaripes]|nr:hypothetical protein B0H19DRAFT_1260738 [Mycena capillaripes]
MTLLESPAYSGLRLILHGPRANTDLDVSLSDAAPSQDEIDDDIDGERETMDLEDLPDDGDIDMPSLSAPSDDEDSDEESDEDMDTDSRMAALHAVIKEASKGVLDSTDAEYKRLIKTCEGFVHDQGFIKEGVKFFTDTPHPESATFIVAWIMNRCVLQSTAVHYPSHLFELR